MDYFLYLLLGLIIIFVELKRKRYFLIDHLTLFNAFFFLVYSFTPIALMFLGPEIIAHDLVLGKYYLGKNPYTASIIFASYLFFIAGYYWGAPRAFASKVSIDFRLDHHLIMRFIPIVYLLLIAIVVIYVQGEGGLERAIDNAELYRSGVIFAKYGYLSRLFPLNQILFLYFFYKLFLEKNSEYRYVYSIYVAISFALFIIIVALSNSRGFLIMSLLAFYIMTVMYHKQYFIKFLIFAGTFGFLVIKYGDPFFHAIPDFINYDFDTFVSSFSDRVNQISAAKGSIVSNFVHPLLSLEVSLQLAGGEVSFRYFVDFLHALIAILPNAIMGIEDPQFVMVLNTELLYGEKVSIVLPGILALFAYSLNVIGVFIGLFLYGVYGGILSEFFRSVYTRYQGSLVFIYLFSMTYGYFVFRGSPRNALMNIFVLLVVVIFLLLFSRISYAKK